MPQKRHSSNNEQFSEDRFQIRSFALNCQPGHVVHAHSHDWHQLIYASRGVMTVNTDDGSWVVPSKRAVWVPAGMTHTVEMSTAVSVRTLYLKPEISAPLPKHCHVITVSPLLRELILHAVKIGMLDRTVRSQRNLIRTIVDQLTQVKAAPLKLPMPNDERALRVAQLLASDPGNTTSIRELARDAGASKRTIERIFLAETLMTFGKWRQQLRVLHALKLLASGQPVTSVALGVGYESTSAFINTFKATLGTTPARYYADSQAGESHAATAID